MRAAAWAVLLAVFLVEVAGIVVLGMWGWHVGGRARWLLVVGLPLVTIVVWWLFAAPRALIPDERLQLVTKTVVFGLAALALWPLAGWGWALGAVVVTVLVHLAAHSSLVQAYTSESFDPDLRERADARRRR